MIVDVHTHIFPPDVVGDRRSFFDGEPEFRLLYDSPAARLATLESLLEVMEEEGVDQAVTFGFPWRDPDTATRHNDYVLDAAARFHSKLIPLACVNLLASDSVKEAERCLQRGARGLGELAVYTATEVPAVLDIFRDVAACCRDHAGVLLLHANEPVGRRYPGKAPLGLDFYYETARLAAGVPLILAHWGGGLGFFELLKREASEVLSEVYYDTAASPYLYRPEIYEFMIRLLGKEKILFGSDYPLLSPSRYFREMSTVCLTEEEKAAVCGGNAVRLFGSRSTYLP